MNAGRWIAIAACALACVSAAAPLTDAEKRLLQSGISQPQANEYGKAGDAAALKRIVALGDPAMVRAFGYGMNLARIETLPPEVEAVVIAHFDDPGVGAELRALQPRYRTRALFDLHYQRIEAAFRADEPSFAQILRTDQPGIEERLLAIAPKYSASRGELNPVIAFLGRRKYAAAVPLLVRSLEETYREGGTRTYNVALGMLLDYPSPEAWRAASEEIERLKREDKIHAAPYAEARGRLDPMLKDSQATLDRRRATEALMTFMRRRDALVPNAEQLRALRDSAPRQYAEEYAKYVVRQEAIAAELGEGLDYQVAGEYFLLGMFARFRLRDPVAAAAHFEKSARAHHAMGQVALADTYQFDLHDKARALRAYEVALEEASKPTEGRPPPWPYAAAGSHPNDWWRGWLEAEIAFLRSGKPFAGRIPEAAIDGFFAVIYGNSGSVADTFAADLPPIPDSDPRLMGARVHGALATAAADWTQVERDLASLDRAFLAKRLERIPASRLALMVSLRAISALPDAPEILRELARNDPSGYWTACALGTVHFQAMKGVASRDEALRNGTARMLPGMAAAGNPNALASAAAQFLRTRGLRTVETSR